MLAKRETLTTEAAPATAVRDWLARFERALAAADRRLLSALFHPQSYWRDLLAFTWEIRTVSGSDAIADELMANAVRTAPARVEVDPDRTAPRRVTRAGTGAIEAIIRFETATGRGSGVLRLTPD